jgi:hypothetical protein
MSTVSGQNTLEHCSFEPKDRVFAHFLQKKSI